MCTARKGSRVLANDLNPDAVSFARENAILNKAELTVLNMDAKELLRLAFTDRLDLPPSQLHVVFNLPELALEILADELRNIASARRFSIYCYTFQSSEPQVVENLKKLEGLSFVEITQVRLVRFVSPSKAMFCVHIQAQRDSKRLCERILKGVVGSTS